MRKLSASIFTVGWVSMKSLMGFAATIITRTATTMARTMIETCCTRPTAVMTESREKTMSMRATWISTAPKLAACTAFGPSSAPSRLLWISRVAFASRNAPPPMRMTSRQETSCPRTATMGAVRLISQVSESRSAIRLPMASPRPSTRADCRRSGGRRPTRMERKMMLSIPSTISRAVSVRSATQASGWRSQSMRGTCRLGSGLIV